MTQASICTIGDEILIGQIVDTNSSMISRALEGIGVKVTRMLSIGDDHREIIDNLRNELEHNEIVICTGGLGPTKDDITKAALAELSGSSRFVENSEQLEIVYAILHSRGLDVLDINKAQAMVPDTCEVIPNRKGTAPIMVFRFPEGHFGHPATLYSLPGVPFEAAGAVPDIISDIKSHNPLTDIH
ncbi:MAG: competence/damage-inducible protein A, partial [Bacteroidales bacterium]|nr:competence/damage-inducible protein A [Bacteroidales bacterium]